MQALLNADPFTLTPIKRDCNRYGRKLRIVERDGVSLGAVLVRHASRAVMVAASARLGDSGHELPLVVIAIEVYPSRMARDDALFDMSDPAAEAEADARADAAVHSGLLISHDAVKGWLSSWGSTEPLPRPRVGD